MQFQNDFPVHAVDPKIDVSTIVLLPHINLRTATTIATNLVSRYSKVIMRYTRWISGISLDKKMGICWPLESTNTAHFQLPLNIRTTATEARVTPRDQFLYTCAEEIRRLRPGPVCDSHLHVFVTVEMQPGQEPFQVLVLRTCWQCCSTTKLVLKRSCARNYCCDDFGGSWEVFDHPAYSPDLAPSDYYFCQHLVPGQAASPQ
ncbi:hypothetical protein AVEN_59226-1 [Araneus ventricosus]|uniref:Uncharacterized protein n=1 Tax=Araneus ventricosus TaxID=182803 RepID=A0A4Y2CZD2_ARAVE|nr:hypothetical protein AVEN_59226-1 [Araneus ventricosus]